MNYADFYSEVITKKLKKLKNKDMPHYETVRKKMEQILNLPNHRHKDLHYTMKGMQRVHIGHFVLVFRVNHADKTVSFEDYDHHDSIYSE